MLALVAEILGDGGGVGRALQTHQWSCVSRGGDDDGTTPAFLTKNLLDEFLDFTTALADQSDDDDLGFRVARHHA